MMSATTTTKAAAASRICNHCTRMMGRRMFMTTTMVKNPYRCIVPVAVLFEPNRTTTATTTAPSRTMFEPLPTLKNRSFGTSPSSSLPFSTIETATAGGAVDETQQQQRLFFSSVPLSQDADEFFDDDDDVHVPQPQQAQQPHPQECLQDCCCCNSYYKILDNLPETFDIDKAKLKQVYMKLMTDYHPDKHGQKTACQRIELENKAMAVTRAYDTLKDPHTRAQHLLEISGHPMSEAASGHDLVGSEFLMHIMEIRETIQYTSDEQELRDMMVHNSEEIETTCHDLSQAFKNQNYQLALELTARLQYFHRIDETLHEKLPIS